MHLLNDMWRTEAQLREKLTRNEYPADIVEAAISYVKSFGYINDYEYARSFIESRKERKKAGGRFICSLWEKECPEN